MQKHIILKDRESTSEQERARLQFPHSLSVAQVGRGGSRILCLTQSGYGNSERSQAQDQSGIWRKKLHRSPVPGQSRTSGAEADTDLPIPKVSWNQSQQLWWHLGQRLKQKTRREKILLQRSERTQLMVFRSSHLLWAKASAPSCKAATGGGKQEAIREQR